MCGTARNKGHSAAIARKPKLVIAGDKTEDSEPLTTLPKLRCQQKHRPNLRERSRVESVNKLPLSWTNSSNSNASLLATGEKTPNDPKLTERSPETPSWREAAGGEGAGCAGLGGGKHRLVTEPVGPQPGAETERQGCGSLQRMVRRSLRLAIAVARESRAARESNSRAPCCGKQRAVLLGSAAYEKPEAVWEWEGNRAACGTARARLKTRGVAVRRKLGQWRNARASPQGCPRERSRASAKLASDAETKSLESLLTSRFRVSPCSRCYSREQCLRRERLTTPSSATAEAGAACAWWVERWRRKQHRP